MPRLCRPEWSVLVPFHVHLHPVTASVALRLEICRPPYTRKKRKDDRRLTYRLATWALSSGCELPESSLISFAIWSNIAEKKRRREKKKEKKPIAGLDLETWIS